MLKSISSVVYGFAALALLAFLLSAPALVQAQAETPATGEEVKDTAQKSRGDGAADENITSRSVENDPNPEAAPPAPPEKGGEKTRGGCYLTVDNHTSWKIQIFVNGNYVGLVSPWGTANGYQSASNFRVYAVATFTNGDELTWGPRVVSCSGSYKWNLWP
jgi:hypothetical protein